MVTRADGVGQFAVAGNFELDQAVHEGSNHCYTVVGGHRH